MISLLRVSCDLSSGNGFDLLESCLKESGIKGGDSDRGGRKITEQQEKQEESGQKSVDLIKEEQEESETKNEVQNVYVCDTLEDVDKVPRKVCRIVSVMCMKFLRVE